MAASAPDHAPAASTTALAATAPPEVRTPATAPAGSTSIAVTDVSSAKVAPARRASVAYPWVRAAGSAIPSPGPKVAPISPLVSMPGTSEPASAGSRTSTSTPSERWSSTADRKPGHAASSRTRKRYPSCDTSTGMPCSSVKRRIIGMLACDRRMLTSLVNCRRKPPAQAPVEPRPTASSRSRTSTAPAPAAARWNATEHPTIPAPITTTSAVAREVVAHRTGLSSRRRGPRGRPPGPRTPCRPTRTP